MPATGGWAVDLLDRLDVPTRLLPEIVPPGDACSARSSERRRRRRASAAPRSSRSATHDTASAVAASRSREPGSAYLSVGTWSLVGVEAREPVITDDGLRART